MELQEFLRVEIFSTKNNKNATLCVHYIDKLPDNKWKHEQICLQAQMDSGVVERWKQAMEKTMTQIRG